MGNGSQKYSAVATAQWYVEGLRTYGREGFMRNSATFGADDLSVDMRGQVVCVTGANKGIGYSVSRALAQNNATVHMLCRDQSRGQEAVRRVTRETGNKDVHLHVVDVSDFSQVEEFTVAFVRDNPRLHVLVNNAGGMPAERTMTPQGNEGIM
ncbi:unnamed protein product, partial [Discosporangium mesarthrocarpum]